jgi:hypothetical protein
MVSGRDRPLGKNGRRTVRTQQVPVPHRKQCNPSLWLENPLELILFSVFGSLTLVIVDLCDQLCVSVACSTFTSQFLNHRSATR